MPVTEHIRLFIALPVAAPAPARRLLERLGAYAPSVKPVDAQAMHLTLRFLGPTPREGARGRAIAGAVDAAVAEAPPGPITLDWHAPSFFPASARKPPRTIVLQPMDLTDAGPLHQLEAALSRHLQRLDPPIEPEPRGFHPHLTLARLKQSKSKTRVPAEQIEAELARFAHEPMPASRLDSVHLYQSTLTPQGPVYETKHRVTL